MAVKDANSQSTPSSDISPSVIAEGSIKRPKPTGPASPISEIPHNTVKPRPKAPAPGKAAPQPYERVFTPNLAGPDSISGSHRNVVEEDLADESLQIESDSSQRKRIMLYLALSAAVIVIATILIILVFIPMIEGFV